MIRLLKWLCFLAMAGFFALLGYAYVGPFFGADFSPPQTETRKEIMLDTE